MVQERAIRTRQAVLEAAREVFSEAGFDGARVDEIARRSGSNKQRIYAYFGSKENLFAEIQHEAIAALANFENSLLATLEQDPAIVTERLLRGYLRFHEEHPRFWRLIAWANLSSIPPSKADDGRRAVLPRLRAVFTRAQAGGHAPAAISFDTWFVTVSSVVLFLFANQKTASINMGIRLDSKATRTRIVEDLLALLGQGTTVLNGG